MTYYQARKHLFSECHMKKKKLIQDATHIHQAEGAYQQTKIHVFLVTIFKFLVKPKT